MERQFQTVLNWGRYAEIFDYDSENHRLFNREDADERRRADACYRKMSQEVAARGVFVGRAPVDYHEFHMAQTIPAFRGACSGIKAALDPNGIIAPGRYGIVDATAR